MPLSAACRGVRTRHCQAHCCQLLRPSRAPCAGKCLPWRNQPCPAGTEPWAPWHLPCDRTWQDLAAKMEEVSHHVQLELFEAYTDFHRDREGCLPAKFQVAVLKDEVDGSARKGTYQISPAVLWFFFFFP